MVTDNSTDVTATLTASTTRPEPCVKKNPNDLILAEDWNEMQIQLREQIGTAHQALENTKKDLKETLEQQGKDWNAHLDQKINKTDFEQQAKDLISFRTELGNADRNLQEEWDKKAQELAAVDNTLRDELTNTDRSLRSDLVQKASLGGSNTTDFAAKDLYVAGNIGIGVNNPQKQLHVEGNAEISQNLKVDGTIHLGDHVVRASRDGGLRVSCANTRWLRLGSGGGIALWGNGQADMDDLPNMVIDAKGAVGIGTLEPQKPLHIEGDVQCNNMYIRGHIWVKPLATASGAGGAEEWVKLSVGTGANKANPVSPAAMADSNAKTLSAIQALKSEKDQEIQALKQENQSLIDRVLALEAKLK